MRKFGLLAALTVVGMLSFTAVAMAAPTPDPLAPNADSEVTSPTNGTGVNTESQQLPDGTTYSGQSFRMTPDSSFTGGNGGTGFDSPTSPSIKWDSPNNQKIHSSYSKTTGACASCHTIHESVNQGDLLQWEDPQIACWSCHDGTVAQTYNVINGTHNNLGDAGQTEVNSAGLFGTGTETGLSNHGMSPKGAGLVTTAAAPGGAETANFGTDSKGKTITTDQNGNWATDFTCVACHDPHGANGNARVLNPNVNGVADAARAQMQTTDPHGETLTNSGDNTHYTAKVGSWMSGHGYDPVVYVNDTIASAISYNVDYLNGKIVFTSSKNPGDVVKAVYSPGIAVTMDIENKLTSNETVKYLKGINQFCGACHTDYNNVGKTTGTNGVGGAPSLLLGDYRKAYRHSVGFTRTMTAADPTFADPNSLVSTYAGLKFDTSNPKNPSAVAPTADCLTCHYAHGTSDDFIQQSLSHQGQLGAFAVISAAYPTGYDASGNPMNAYGDKAIQTYDTGRTTAMKRLPNMGVCQACHNKQGTTPQTTP